MVVGEVAERTGVAVIGGGPGGYAAALRCAANGAQVTLIERDAVGGTCLNVGCIPSKTLLHAAAVVGAARRGAVPGVALTAEVDPVAMLQHRLDVVETLTGGVRALLSAAGVDVWSGHASFARANRLAVTTGDQVRHLEFDHVVLATGSSPIALPHLPTDGVRVLDSTGALALDRVPESMVIVGGGYIGVELGTAFANLGTAVTIVEAAPRLLPAMDRRAGSAVARRLKELGAAVRTSTTAGAPTASGIELTTANGGTEEVEADTIVVAVGRRPNTAGLGLERAGVTADEAGHVPVDAQGRAGHNIWALGDLTAGPALAHKATAEAEVVAAAIAGGTATFDPRSIPEVVFGDPEVVRVGASADDEAAAGRSVRVARFPHVAGARSRTVGDTSGFVQLVADDAGTVIGALAVGAHVAELAGELSTLVELCVALDEVAEIIHPHPTMSEGIVEAALMGVGRPLHGRS